jgi:hypothetical protein
MWTILRLQLSSHHLRVSSPLLQAVSAPCEIHRMQTLKLDLCFTYILWAPEGGQFSSQSRSFYTLNVFESWAKNQYKYKQVKLTELGTNAGVDTAAHTHLRHAHQTENSCVASPYMQISWTAMSRCTWLPINRTKVPNTSSPTNLELPEMTRWHIKEHTLWLSIEYIHKNTIVLTLYIQTWAHPTTMNETHVPLFLLNEPIARSVNIPPVIFPEIISGGFCVSASPCDMTNTVHPLLHTQGRTEPSQVELHWPGQKGQNKDTTRNTMYTHSNPQTLQ